MCPLPRKNKREGCFDCLGGFSEGWLVGGMDILLFSPKLIILAGSQIGHSVAIGALTPPPLSQLPVPSL